MSLTVRRPSIRRSVRRSIRRSIGGGLGLVLAAALFVACSGPGGTSGTSDSQGPGAAESPSPRAVRLVTTGRSAPGGFKARLAGTIGLTSGGCLSLDGRLLVAPEGAVVRSGVVEIPGYAPFRIGDEVVLEGGEADLGADEVSGGAECAPDRVEVVLVAAR